MSQIVVKWPITQYCKNIFLNSWIQIQKHYRPNFKHLTSSSLSTDTALISGEILYDDPIGTFYAKLPTDRHKQTPRKHIIWWTGGGNYYGQCDYTLCFRKNWTLLVVSLGSGGGGLPRVTPD